MLSIPRLSLAALLALTPALALPITALAGQSPPPTPPAAAAPLSVQRYHPGASAMFAVASNLVSGRRDALLVDAQFARHDAAQLVQLIRDSGKRLTTIYISHGDPDYYFGLATLQDAFPEARIVASAATVAHIRATAAAKLAYWGPQMGTGQPTRIVIPEVLAGDRLSLEGQPLQIIGLDGPTAERSVLWIPSLRTLLGGIAVVAGEHVWMADTQSPQSHRDWLQLLQRLQALKPQTVIPGHYAAGAALDASALRFTADYIRAFDLETARAADSQALVQAMQARYPDLAGVDALQLSAKVAKGELQWP